MKRFVELADLMKKEFGFSICFLCDRQGEKMVLSSGDTSYDFKGFLIGRLREKEDAYFSGVRFFRYRSPSSQESEHLALIPIEMEHVPFVFLGFVYARIEFLDHLMKSRLLPAYLTYWLKNIVAERELSSENEESVRRLVIALEEKRQYTNTLEHKVADLKKKIEDIQTAKGGKDVELFALRELLEEQFVEYQKLVAEYRSLFSDHETLEKEYLSAIVSFETQLYQVSTRDSGVEGEEIQRLSMENSKLKQDLIASEALQQRYRHKYQQILKSFAGWSTDMLAEFQQKVRDHRFRKKDPPAGT